MINMAIMAHSHCTGPGQGPGLGNDGFLYYTMYCTHCTGPGSDGFLYYTMYCSHCTGPGTGKRWVSILHNVLYTLHGTGTRKRWVSALCYILFTLHRERDRDG